MSRRLYSRLETLTGTIRAAVIDTVLNFGPIREVFNDPQYVADAVQATSVRFAGAPRGSWAGLQTALPDGHLASSDGPLVAALKSSRAMFQSRIGLTFSSSTNACDGPPVYDALTSNAYIYPTAQPCQHILLGILRAPLADERFDNVSLATRVGYVLAHELGHNALVSHWHPDRLWSLLWRYTDNLHSEALADVIAVVAIVRTGMASAQEVCERVSQVWCARVRFDYSPRADASHPGPNFRGDALCETLRDLGFL